MFPALHILPFDVTGNFPGVGLQVRLVAERDLFLQDAIQLTQTQEPLREVMTGLMQEVNQPLNYNQAWKLVKSLSRELKSWPLRRKQQKSLLA